MLALHSVDIFLLVFLCFIFSFEFIIGVQILQIHVLGFIILYDLSTHMVFLNYYLW